MELKGNLPVGEVSRQTGCNIETIRYYERIGLVPAPRRSGRFRTYSAADVRRLAFVRRARGLGFKLDQVRVLLELASDREPSCAMVCTRARALAVNHLAEVRARIADLRSMEQALEAAVRRCEANNGPGCPVLDNFSSELGPEPPTGSDGLA